MDEVLVEGQAVDPEDPPGRSVDADDVIAPVDDDDTDRQVEEQRLRSFGQVGGGPDVLARRPDGAIKLVLGGARRAGDRRARHRQRRGAGESPEDPHPAGSSRYGPGRG